MSKQIIDCGFGVIETRETFYTEETISKLNQQIAELQKQLEEKEQIIEMQQNIKRYDIGEMLTENVKLKQQLKSQPAEIVEKIRMKLPNRCYGKKLFKNILKEVLAEYKK